MCNALNGGHLSPSDLMVGRLFVKSTRAKNAEMAGIKRQQEFPFKDFGPKRINTFCRVLRTKFADKGSNLGKEYLKLLVDEIRIEGREVTMRGKYTDVVNAMQKTAPSFPVGLPRTGRAWLPKPDGAGQWIEYLSVQKPVRFL